MMSSRPFVCLVSTALFAAVHSLSAPAFVPLRPRPPPVATVNTPASFSRTQARRAVLKMVDASASWQSEISALKSELQTQIDELKVQSERLAALDPTPAKTPAAPASEATLPPPELVVPPPELVAPPPEIVAPVIAPASEAIAPPTEAVVPAQVADVVNHPSTPEVIAASAAPPPETHAVPAEVPPVPEIAANVPPAPSSLEMPSVESVATSVATPPPEIHAVPAEVQLPEMATSFLPAPSSLELPSIESVATSVAAPPPEIHAVPAEVPLPEMMADSVPNSVPPLPSPLELPSIESVAASVRELTQSLPSLPSVDSFLDSARGLVPTPPVDGLLAVGRDVADALSSWRSMDGFPFLALDGLAAVAGLSLLLAAKPEEARTPEQPTVRHPHAESVLDLQAQIAELEWRIRSEEEAQKAADAAAVLRRSSEEEVARRLAAEAAAAAHRRATEAAAAAHWRAMTHAGESDSGIVEDELRGEPATESGQNAAPVAAPVHSQHEERPSAGDVSPVSSPGVTTTRKEEDVVEQGSEELTEEEDAAARAAWLARLDAQPWKSTAVAEVADAEAEVAADAEAVATADHLSEDEARLWMVSLAEDEARQSMVSLDAPELGSPSPDDAPVTLHEAATTQATAAVEMEETMARDADDGVHDDVAAVANPEEEPSGQPAPAWPGFVEEWDAAAQAAAEIAAAAEAVAELSEEEAKQLWLENLDAKQWEQFASALDEMLTTGVKIEEMTSAGFKPADLAKAARRQREV